MPCVYVKCDEDGTEEWNVLSLFGDTILVIRPHKAKKGRHYTETFNEVALGWLGYIYIALWLESSGSRVEDVA